MGYPSLDINNYREALAKYLRLSVSEEPNNCLILSIDEKVGGIPSLSRSQHHATKIQFHDLLVNLSIGPPVHWSSLESNIKYVRPSKINVLFPVTWNLKIG